MMRNASYLNEAKQLENLDEMNKIQSDRIKVEGELYIGEEKELDQKVGASQFGFSVYQTGAATLPSYEKRNNPVRPGELVMRRLNYKLISKAPVNNSSRGIFIENDGLCASYGIFGAPGSGKTHLLMLLLKQILDMHKDAAQLKFGGLILDPKAALIKDIKEM